MNTTSFGVSGRARSARLSTAVVHRAVGLAGAIAFAVCSIAGFASAQPTLIFRESAQTTLSNGKEVVVEEIAFHSAIGSYAWAARIKASGLPLIVGDLTESGTVDWLVEPSPWLDGSQLGIEPSFALGARGELAYSTLIADRPAPLQSSIHGVLDAIWLRPSDGQGEDRAIARRGDEFLATVNGSTPSGAAWTATSVTRFAGSGEVLFLGASAEKMHYPANERGLWVWRGDGVPVELLLAAKSQVGQLKLDTFPIAEFAAAPLGSDVWAICNTNDAGRRGVSAVAFDLRDTTATPAVLRSRGDLIAQVGQAQDAIMSMRSIVGCSASACSVSSKWLTIAQTDSYQNRNVVLLNGQVIFREGAVIAGTTSLIGEPSSLAINDSGDWVVGWRGSTPPSPGAGPAGAPVETPLLLLNGVPVDTTGVIENRWVIDSFVRGGSSGGGGSLAISSRVSQSGVRIFATVMLRDTLSSETPAPLSRALISLWAPTFSGCCPVDLTGNHLGAVHAPDGQVNDEDAKLFGLWAAVKDLRGDLDDGSGTGTPDGTFDQSDITYFFDSYFLGCS